MSPKSHRKVGWLVRPLLAILTVGLANPSVENEGAPGTKHALAGPLAPPPLPIGKRTVSLALEQRALAPSPVGLAETKSVQPEHFRNLDWQKAREFQLPARLAVTAQMNRPKSKIAKPKKTRTIASTGFSWRRSENEIRKPRPTNRETAKLLEFPSKQSPVGLPVVAAAA